MTEIEKIIDIILPAFLAFIEAKEKAQQSQILLDNKVFPSINTAQEVTK